jgi:hypothetical protein
MYNLKRLAAGFSITLMIFTLVITICSRSSGSQNLFSKNRLTNIKWEWDKGTIDFGENSFRMETNGNSIIISGSYSLSGDVINYDYNFLGHQQDSGSLIGDTLSMFGHNYKRVK